MEDSGYVACSTDVEQPLTDIIGQEKPDLILLDIMMPYKSGLSVYRLLRSNPFFCTVPVVMISGMDYQSDFSELKILTRLEAEKLPHPDAFLEKPLNIPALLQIIETLFKKRGQQDVVSGN